MCKKGHALVSHLPLSLIENSIYGLQGCHGAVDACRQCLVQLVRDVCPSNVKTSAVKCPVAGHWRCLGIWASDHSQLQLQHKYVAKKRHIMGL